LPFPSPKFSVLSVLLGPASIVGVARGISEVDLRGEKCGKKGAGQQNGTTHCT